MQLTEETIAQYKAEAPELLDAVTSGEAAFIMKRDATTDYCVKFDAGLCTIHRDYGDTFLGDACHFYPRITRALGGQVLTTLALSCPEAARLMLTENAAFDLSPREEIRVPFSLKNYLPKELSEDGALAIHQQFIAEMDNEAYSAEHHAMRISAVARALETQPVASWPAATAFYFKMAEGRIPPAEIVPSDAHHLVNALQGLIRASKATSRPRLMEIVERMAKALGATLDWEAGGMGISPDAPSRIVRMLHYWKEQQAALQPLLRRYLQAQLSQSLFPFAGLGATLSERMTIISVRLATLKLALMSDVLLARALPTEEEILRTVYTLSRFLDHLAEPELSLAIYQETGWMREARLRGLLGDIA